jgi:protein-tyrosine phosphatase
MNLGEPGSLVAQFDRWRTLAWGYGRENKILMAWFALKRPSERRSAVVDSQKASWELDENGLASEKLDGGLLRPAIIWHRVLFRHVCSPTFVQGKVTAQSCGAAHHKSRDASFKQVVTSPMHEAIPNQLWLGTAKDTRDIKGVLSQRIIAVIDLAMEEPAIHFPRDIVYCRIPLVDGAGNRPEVIRAAVDLTASFIDSGVPTLVACGAGMSRSPIVVAAALAKIDGSTIEEALEEITSGVAHDVSTSLWADVKAACEKWQDD